MLLTSDSMSLSTRQLFQSEPNTDIRECFSGNRVHTNLLARLLNGPEDIIIRKGSFNYDFLGVQINIVLGD